MHETIVILLRVGAGALVAAMVGTAVYQMVHALRALNRARATRAHLQGRSDARALRGVPCRFEGPWWWVAWGAKWLLRGVDLWLTPDGVVMAFGRMRDGLFAHYAREGAPVIPGPPPRFDVLRAELAGDEVRLVLAPRGLVKDAVLILKGLPGREREAVCAMYSGAARVA